MKNVNSILQERIYDALNGNLSVPVYGDYLPPSVNPNGYVIISWMNHRQMPAFLQVNTDTTFQLSIFTKDTSANPGTLCNTVADEIFSILIPDNDALIDLEPELQSVSLNLEADNKPQPLTTNDAIFINRYLTFRANIYHKQ